MTQHEERLERLRATANYYKTAPPVVVVKPVAEAAEEKPKAKRKSGCDTDV